MPRGFEQPRVGGAAFGAVAGARDHDFLPLAAGAVDDGDGLGAGRTCRAARRRRPAVIALGSGGGLRRLASARLRPRRSAARWRSARRRADRRRSAAQSTNRARHMPSSAGHGLAGAVGGREPALRAWIVSCPSGVFRSSAIGGATRESSGARSSTAPDSVAADKNGAALRPPRELCCLSPGVIAAAPRPACRSAGRPSW